MLWHGQFNERSGYINEKLLKFQVLGIIINEEIDGTSPRF